MFNFINSWKSRKKPQWNVEVRLGRLTLLQQFKKQHFQIYVIKLWI